MDELRDIYSISRLNREAKSLLEGSFPLLWIEGEVSNFARPASGHWYFSLKDEAAQVRCAMFRNRNSLVPFTPKNGQQILIRARISLYEARGEYQIIAEHMEESGDGALKRAFEELKLKLHKEGLFASEHKRPLPAGIHSIGVITSPTGAAIRDILTTLHRRYPSAKVIVYPVAVQGEQSARQIADMLNTVQKRNEVDVILLARGGGSLEDLWSFNEEIVARAIYQCELPVVCGIGHEIDITIADLVADVRAPTPTAAAELVSPNQFELSTKFKLLQSRLNRAIKRTLEQFQQRLSLTAKRLQHPERRIQSLSQRLDELQTRANQAISSLLHKYSLQQRILFEKLTSLHPRQRIAQQRQHCAALSTRLQYLMQQIMQSKRQQFIHQSKMLHTVSPLATLERGYAIVSDATDNRVIRHADTVKVGDSVNARLAHGKLKCQVTEIKND